MNELSKQQIILLALLVSFVTSLSTGIVTVSLMDQAPSGVTRTITQVIQQTVAGAVPSTATSSVTAVSIAVSDQVADATAVVTPSIVRLRDGDTGPVKGLGLIVSSSGTIITDKNLMDSLDQPQAIFSDGTVSAVTITRFQVEGDIAFLAPATALSTKVKPISFADSVRLGQSVWSLFGTSTYSLSQGIASELDPMTTSSSSIIYTTIPGTQVLVGSPLFNATGAIIGIETKSYQGSSAAFYPIQAVKDAVPH